MAEAAMTKFLEISSPSGFNSTWRQSCIPNKKQTLQVSDLCLPVAFCWHSEPPRPISSNLSDKSPIRLFRACQTVC